MTRKRQTTPPKKSTTVVKKPADEITPPVSEVSSPTVESPPVVESPPASQTVLYIDTRERDVAAIAEMMDSVAAEKEDLNRNAARSGYRYEKRQITTGDFAIVRSVNRPNQPPDEYILASVERKSLVDYAASLRDGRYENIQKQLALREKYGTQVYLLIEGPLFPSPSRRFSRWPFRVIESSFTDLMVEHGIQVLFTPDPARSASRMLDLQRAYYKLADISRWRPVTGEMAPVGGPANGSPTATTNTALDVLTAVHAKSPAQDLLTMWSALPRVSRVLGTALANAWTVEELLAGTQADRTRRILALRTPLGKQFPVNSRRVLGELGTSHEIQIRLLAGVPGISRQLALHLLDPAKGRATIQHLLGQNPKDAPPPVCAGDSSGKKKAPKPKPNEPRCALAMIEVPHGGTMRPLGQLKAEKILGMLRRKLGDVTDANGADANGVSTDAGTPPTASASTSASPSADEASGDGPA